MRLLYFFLSSSVLIGLVLLIRRVFRKKLAPGVIYALWLIPLLRLCIPFAGWELPVFGTTGAFFNAPYTFVSQWLEQEENSSVGYETSIMQDNAGVKENGNDTTEGTKIYDAAVQKTDIVKTQKNTALDNITEQKNRTTVEGYQIAALSIWLAGVLLLSIYVILQNQRLKRSTADARIIAEVENLKVCISDETRVPCLVGLRNPKILITQEVFENAALYECVLQHELAHYHQKDLIWNAVKISMCVFYWWHPLIWLAAACVDEDAELACDARVLKSQTNEGRRSYGYALLQMLENAQEKGKRFYVATSMYGGKKSMKRRIAEISNRTTTRKYVFLPLIGVLVATLILGCAVPTEKSWIKMAEWENAKGEDSMYSEGAYKYVLQEEMQSQLFYYEIYEHGRLIERKVLAYGKIEEPTGQLKMRREFSTLDEERKLILEMDKVGIEMPMPSKTDKEGSLIESVLWSVQEEMVIEPGDDLILLAEFQPEDEENIKTHSCTELSGMSEEKLLETLKDNYLTTFVRVVLSEKTSQELKEIYMAKELVSAPDGVQKVKTQDNTADSAKNLTECEELAATWAEAFIDRDAESLEAMATEEAKQQMIDYAILDESLKSFGWSSPWPMFGEQLYQIISCDENGAEILYYASDSTPHVTVWQEKLGFEEVDGKLAVSSWQIHWCDAIYEIEDFYTAYPNKEISGTPMDYYTNGLGEALNKNAMQSSSMEYRELFDPVTAAAKLLNISTDKELTSFVAKAADVETMVQIFFLNDNGSSELVEVVMWQPYGENGIWIPK